MKLLYKPFAIIAGLIASRIGQKVFKTLWAKIDEREPPKPGSGEAGLPKVVAAAALEAATMAGVSAAVDRGTATTFHHLTGSWPAKQDEEEKDEDQ